MANTGASFRSLTSLLEVPSNVLAGGDVILAGQCGSSLESLHGGSGDRGLPGLLALCSCTSKSSLGWDWREKSSILNLFQKGLSGD